MNILRQADVDEASYELRYNAQDEITSLNFRYFQKIDPNSKLQVFSLVNDQNNEISSMIYANFIDQINSSN